MKRAAEHSLLLEQFISCFSKHDEMSVFPDLDPIAAQLAIGQADEFGRLLWAPKKVQTNPQELELLYQNFPARFPPLYEQLVLSYRWAEVDLGTYTLLASPPGPNLLGIVIEVSKAPNIWDILPQNGYIQFGKGPDIDYDPVCFDLSARKQNREYAIVKIDHEEILCNNRIKVVKKMAPSFRDLVLQTISDT